MHWREAETQSILPLATVRVACSDKVGSAAVRELLDPMNGRWMLDHFVFTLRIYDARLSSVS